LVVKGDGSLIKADVAIKRPVETILSGPAASIVGAQRLSGNNDCWVVDIGGTTTDIGKLTGGRIDLNHAGATIAGKRTMVESADIYTLGLGGDSQVHLTSDGGIRLGPRRMVPLCLLAEAFPSIVDRLRNFSDAGRQNPSEGLFVSFLRNPLCDLSEDDQRLLDIIRNAPLPLVFSGREGLILARRLEAFENMALIQRDGFTPTDALHALGRLSLWNAEASRLGAVILAEKSGRSPESLCRAVIERVSEEVARAIVGKIMNDRVGSTAWQSDKAAGVFMEEAIRPTPASEMICRLGLRRSIVAIGAPAAAYMPKTSQMLNTPLVVPPHADVANAVGAVVGVVMHSNKILITPLEGGRIYRVHLPDGVRDFAGLEEAVDFAIADYSARFETASKKAGAADPAIQVQRTDRVIQGIYLDTELIFTATGRPAMAA
jgi:N-methylhydantoinase A/oxoprolinase/acetone carboxylase beta subunit